MTTNSLPLLLVVLMVLPLSFLGSRSAADDARSRQDVAKLLESALTDASHNAGPKELAELQVTVENAIEQLSTDHLGNRMLVTALETSRASRPEAAGKTTAQLRKSARRVYEMLTFEPVMESEMPDGFPAWTPVGKIEVKEYPKYRMARFSMGEGGRENSAFFALFRYINENRIAMTAPVEMEYRIDGKSGAKQMNMAFLYRSTKLGSVGTKPSGIKVADVAAKTVVSIGMCGPTSDNRIAEAQGALESWLERNRRNYQADGPLRVMGYNSPFVLGNRRYFEVQIPIRGADTTDGKR